MSRYGPPRGGGGFRSSADDLAYGDYPQRWDRDRLERFNRGPPPLPPDPPRRFEEDFRFTERDRPGRRDITVADRVEERRGGRDEERERIYRETFGERPGPRRRTDRELFGEVDPRDIAEMAMTPYRRKSVTSREIDININQRAEPPRPGLLRRQSSLDTFDRRPGPRYEREDYRIPAYTPVPLPIRRRDDDFEEIRYHDAQPENYREVEVKRERSVHRRRSKAPKSVTTVRSSSSSSSSFEEVERVSRHSSPERRKFKKGKTRMPKRLVQLEAIQDLGYPYEEEADFYVLRVALQKEQIDEVIKISEMYKSGDNRKIYRFEERVEEAPVVPAPPLQGEREEIIRKEWINPPSNVGRSTIRGASPSANSSVSRRLSPARTHVTARSRGRSTPGNREVFEERRTIIDERGPPPPPTVVYPPASVRGPPPAAPEFFEERKTIIEERAPGPPSGALVIQEREVRSDRDIAAEIRALEAERHALRVERERPEEEFQLVEYRRERSRPRREVLEIIEREPSPPRNVVRVEKDRKERRRTNPKLVAAAMATLT